MRVEELLTERDHVLVAFDGPVAELPSAGPRTDRLRVMVADRRLPRKVTRTGDPFVILAYAATIGPATERAVYAQLCRIEHEVVAAARVTPGVREALATMAAAGTQITVVSSLATAAVRTFLVIHGLAEHARHLVGRTGPDRTVLPPAPNLINAAIHERATPAESCLFVGSMDADLTAARAAGVDAIRHRRAATSPAAEPATPPPPPTPWFDALSTAAKG
ncbi:haloacid dehalogenase-like hydrolase [Actinocrispum wychmicini]|uniref:Haloacid dehalogenase-like hydrolase n=1 Tax=Actinocrispum wychmicini TaxID=1213861 RepID=A0A4V2S5P2_9PSEU|nr:haloacid dehalogenase-like hydrolase [Actinocrispum wychmicini]